MRISQSSSLFLATLAISSSSSTLAAPTEPGSLDTTGLSSSSSIRSLAMAGRGDSMSVDFGGPVHQANSATAQDTSIHLSHDRRDLLGSLLSVLDGLPLGLGPILQSILQGLGLLGGSGAAIESVSNMGNEQLAVVKAALQQALNGIQNTTGSVANGVVGTVGSSIPSLHRRDGGPSAASSSMIFASQYPASSSVHSTSGTSTSLEALGLPTPAAGSGAPGLPVTTPGLPVNPLSPSLPINPPNSPTTILKKLPIPTGVAPPKGPIPRDAPPMFPAYKAAVAPSSTPTSLGAGSSDAASSSTMFASQSSVAVSQSAAASAPSVPA